MSSATQDEIEEIGKLVAKSRIALLTTVDEEGRLLSRPLAVIERDFDLSVWFFVGDNSHKVHQIEENPQVNVAFESGAGYLSLAGRASLVTDRDKIDEYWNAGAEAWFIEGKDDPHVALLRVTAESAEYWANTDPKPVALLKYAKAIATNSRPDTGENRSVDL
ncbi:MAG: pyridoxamine 5'-phosphate oxidase family protein [Naasia sp.]